MISARCAAHPSSRRSDQVRCGSNSPEDCRGCLVWAQMQSPSERPRQLLRMVGRLALWLSRSRARRSARPRKLSKSGNTSSGCARKAPDWRCEALRPRRTLHETRERVHWPTTADLRCAARRPPRAAQAPRRPVDVQYVLRPVSTLLPRRFDYRVIGRVLTVRSTCTVYRAVDV